MKYIAAYLLAVLGGNEAPTSDDVRNVITSVGIDIDEEKLKLLMEKLRGKNIDEIKIEGQALLFTTVFGTSNTSVPEDVEVCEVKTEPEAEKLPAESNSDSDDSEGIFNLFE